MILCKFKNSGHFWLLSILCFIQPAELLSIVDIWHSCVYTIHPLYPVSIEIIFISIIDKKLPKEYKRAEQHDNHWQVLVSSGLFSSLHWSSGVIKEELAYAKPCKRSTQSLIRLRWNTLSVSCSWDLSTDNKSAVSLEASQTTLS